MNETLAGRWRKAGTDDYWIVTEVNPNGSVKLVLPPDPNDPFGAELVRILNDQSELFGGYYRE